MSESTEMMRLDGGLVNGLTGMGIAGRDKTVATVPSRYRHILSQGELEALYHAGLPRRFVDAIADEALKHHVTIKLGDALEEKELEQINRFESYLKKIGFYRAFADVQRLQRLYGGAVLLALTDDPAETYEEPLDYGKVRSIVGFVPLSRWEITPEDFTVFDYTKPNYYRLNTSKKLVQEQKEALHAMKIHYSRVFRFDGLYLPWSVRQSNTGWGLSVMQGLWDAWKRYESSLHGLESTITDGSQFWHKIPGLMAMIKAGNEKEVLKRLELNNLARSVYGGMLLDAGAGGTSPGEEIGFSERSLSNLSNASAPFAEYLQAATGWPASILMGKSPGGLGKEGRFEERVWAGIVDKWQTCYTREPIEELFRLVFLTKDGPTRGREPSNWQVHFPSVFTYTDKEKAELRKLHADTDTIYVNIGALDPMEVRESRFGGPEYNNEISLNKDYSERLKQKSEAQFLSEMAGLETAILQTQQSFLEPGQGDNANATQSQEALAPGGDDSDPARGNPDGLGGDGSGSGSASGSDLDSGGAVLPAAAGSNDTPGSMGTGSVTESGEEAEDTEAEEDDDDDGDETSDEGDEEGDRELLEEILNDSAESEPRGNPPEHAGFQLPEQGRARYDAHGIELKIVSTKNGTDLGVLVPRSGQSDQTIACILGPNRSRRYSVYQGYVADGRPGPLLTGFASLRAAKTAMDTFYNCNTVLKKVPLSNLPSEFFER